MTNEAPWYETMTYDEFVAEFRARYGHGGPRSERWYETMRDPDHVAKIVARYRAGETMKSIAADTHLCVGTVAKYVRRACSH